MKVYSANEIRRMFLDFFKEKGHMIEPGASLIPQDDPTLLWINSGIAALKKYFDGSCKPENNRIANAQKSIRTNDIENVGKTARHQTFFEMLGNFSIGDYFKEEAIGYAWEFLTSSKWMNFDPEKLYITVYTDDEESYELWVEKCKVKPSHILKTDNNFWEIGKGPGGPDSEIFYDRGPIYDPQNIGEPLFFEEIENERYVEIWNIVFSQYDCDPNVDRKNYHELPQKNIDTGMGFERLVAIAQNVESNFDSDVFSSLIKACEKYSKIKYCEPDAKMAYRVIVDHIRAITFALGDGAMFANEGRGYVLRRLLRRAMRFAKTLEISQTFLYKLVPSVISSMEDFYSELKNSEELIVKFVKIEEERFLVTLADGEKLLREKLQSNIDSKVLDGSTVFQLYDTYGYPFELTKEIAEDAHFIVDEEGFRSAMEKQKTRARKARGERGSMSSQSADLLNMRSNSEFIGYDLLKCDARVIALFKDGKIVDQIEDEGDVMFDQTVFYAESGGQMGDHGYISSSAMQGKVSDTIKAIHKQHLHHVRIKAGKIVHNMKLSMEVDVESRILITRNHSCIHLLQSALKEVIGKHIQQAGSFVNHEYFRFDFTHFEKIDEEQLSEIEMLINVFINKHLLVEKEEMGIEEAKNSGAIGLFDEKYGEIVRVVSMGEISREFCGGCHVFNTQDIGICKLISEESVGSGIRRIVGVTGMNAYEKFKENERILLQVGNCLQLNNVQQVVMKVQQLQLQLETQNEILAQMKTKDASQKIKILLEEFVSCKDFNVLIKQIDDADVNILKDMANQLKTSVDNSVIFFASVQNGKVVFVASASKDAVLKGINCGRLVREAAQICGGNGGGKADFAQSGAKDALKINDAIIFIKNMLA